MPTNPSLVGSSMAVSDSRSLPLDVDRVAVVLAPGASSPPAGFSTTSAPTAPRSPTRPEISPHSAIRLRLPLAASPGSNRSAPEAWAATRKGVK